MVNTQEHLPSPPLRNYVRCYVLREFDTGNLEICKPLPAVPGMFITFWLESAAVSLVKDGRIESVNARERQLVGMQTGYLGHLAFRGRFRIFGIQFQANGFHRIFGIPGHSTTNGLLETDQVIGTRLQQLEDQFREAGSIRELYQLADQFLLTSLLKSSTASKDQRIDHIAGAILRNNGLVQIEKLADQASMSLRGMEQKFTEQVGLSPKLYARIIRFNHALGIKLGAPEKNWTSIAHSCGYYDQMHFIKDFKSFAGQTPNQFIKQIPQPREHITLHE